MEWIFHGSLRHLRLLRLQASLCMVPSSTAIRIQATSWWTRRQERGLQLPAVESPSGRIFRIFRMSKKHSPFNEHQCISMNIRVVETVGPLALGFFFWVKLPCDGISPNLDLWIPSDVDCALVPWRPGGLCVLDWGQVRQLSQPERAWADLGT